MRVSRSAPGTWVAERPQRGWTGQGPVRCGPETPFAFPRAGAALGPGATQDWRERSGSAAPCRPHPLTRGRAGTPRPRPRRSDPPSPRRATLAGKPRQGWWKRHPPFERRETAAPRAAGRGPARRAGLWPGSTWAPCGGKCGTGLNRTGRDGEVGATFARPGEGGLEAAGLTRERLKAVDRKPSPTASVMSPHLSPISDRPDLPPRLLVSADDPLLTKTVLGLEDRARLATTALGRRNWVSLSQTAPRFTFFLPLNLHPLSGDWSVRSQRKSLPPLLNQLPLSIYNHTTLLAVGQQRRGERRRLSAVQTMK